jgi:hypothetical protein
MPRKCGLCNINFIDMYSYYIHQCNGKVMFVHLKDSDMIVPYPVAEYLHREGYTFFQERHGMSYILGRGLSYGARKRLQLCVSDWEAIHVYRRADTYRLRFEGHISTDTPVNPYTGGSGPTDLASP